MTAVEVHQLCVATHRLFLESTERLQARKEDDVELDEDGEVEAEEQKDVDRMLRVNYAELLGALMEVHKMHFVQQGLPLFVPLVQELVGEGRTSTDHCVALYLASDFV